MADSRTEPAPFPLNGKFFVRNIGNFPYKEKNGTNAVKVAGIPVEENGRCRGEQEEETLAFLYKVVDTQQHKGQHVHTIQPHNVHRLGNVVLHECITDRQKNGEKRLQVDKPFSQEVRHCCSCQRQFYEH